MRKLQNTLYVTTENSYLALDGENVLVLLEENVLGRVPLHNLDGIVYFGYKGASPALMGKCARQNISLSFLTPAGRFLAKVTGPTKGNVILRETQVLWSKDETQALHLAQLILVAKLYNSRWVLERFLRDYALRLDVEEVRRQSAYLRNTIPEITKADSIETLMGLEGIAAKAYFQVFDQLILRNKDELVFSGRSRRPPLDPVNAMLSFAYTILGLDISSALETVGIDPYIGFLHQIRPGRKSLALDLIEELRAPIADRFVLTLINLGIVSGKDFNIKENGAVFFTDEGKKVFLTEWQKRKQETITHPYLKEKIPWGLVPYTQALLLSRYMRGDMDDYPPFLWK